MDADVDVVVIGAGLAGLGAASVLRTMGRSWVVLEASGRVGGRAWTTHPASLGGVWFDMGAVWFHDAEHNPLVPIAAVAGDRLLRSNEIRTERTYCDWIRRYIKFHDMSARADLAGGESKIEAFLSHLAVKGNVAVSTQNQAFNALLFLYGEVLHQELGSIEAVRATRPVRVPSPARTLGAAAAGRWRRRTRPGPGSRAPRAGQRQPVGERRPRS